MKCIALLEDEEIHVELDYASLAKVRARIDGRHYEIHLREVEPGIFFFTDQNRSIEATVTSIGNNYIVGLGGHFLSIQLLDPRAALHRSEKLGQDGPVELRAPMPGKVVNILVKEGDLVEENQGLIVIEAMKMQNEMRSPKAGTVQKLSVEAGITVDSGDLLVKIT